MSSRRLVLPGVGLAGFILLGSAALLQRRSSSGELSFRKDPIPPPMLSEPLQHVPERPKSGATSSQEGNWYHHGDPVVISAWISEIDQLEREGADFQPFADKLIPKMGNVLGQNGIHSLKLMKKILCDGRLPKELRETVLAYSSSYTAPEAARFLADLVAEGRIVPDVLDAAMFTLGGLSRFFQEDGEDSLRAAGRRAYEAAAASADPQVRAAATSQYLQLGGSRDAEEAGEELLRIFRSDPELEVQRSAAMALRFSGYAKGNEPIAEETAGIVARSTDTWIRLNAMGLLLATESERAKKTIRTCLADPDESLRNLAILGVGQYHLTEALPLLARWLTGPEAGDDTLRIYCIDSLQMIPTPESVRVLLQSIAAEEDASIHLRAADALMENTAVSQEELAQDLIGLYEKRKDSPEADFFIGLLGRNDTERSYGVLTAAYASAPPERQQGIASVLLGYGHAEAFAEANFAKLVVTENGESAVRALGPGNGDRAVAEIAKSYALEGVSEATRRASIEVLGKIGSLGAVEVLEGLLKTEPAEDLRGRIREALQKIVDDP